MQVSYSEELANHTGPESWLFSRKGLWQALTGEGMGWVLSREIFILECRRSSCLRKAISDTSQWRDVFELHEVGDPMHVPKLLTRNLGGPAVGRALSARSVWPEMKVQP